MHLLHLTLQQPSGISSAIYGNFSSSKAQEIISCHGHSFTLSRPDEHGKVHDILKMEVFGIIRSMAPFRLTGGNKDYVVIGSDSGKIAILEYQESVKTFVALHMETFGKTGCRRITPGQYVAIDPKGRAVMIGAIEKQKLVYVMNRNDKNELTISSPLEAHRNGVLHYDMIGVDVGFENPIFATIELEYLEEEKEKVVVFYELDLGLNHVTRRWSSPVPESAHKLIQIPGGNEGPGGVLVCAFDQLIYKNENHVDVTCAIPKRQMASERSMMVIATATHKQRDLFFVLIQTEMGDLFKVSLEYSSADDIVREIRIRLFDSIPIASAICITRTGFLFVASESANHYLFQFQGLGDETNMDIQASSLTNNTTAAIVFNPTKLQNLSKIDEMESLSPILDVEVADLAREDTPQIYALVGRAERSSLRILRHGLAVTEMAVSELPGYPTAVWCIKETNQSAHDRYIVVSFSNATLVLSIGETVEEVSHSGLLADTPTLLVTLLQDDSILQIYTHGVRHIVKNRPVTEWKAPGKKVIEKCAANGRQVVLSLAGGELVYFELEFTVGSESAGTLVEKTTTELGIEISCVALGEVPSGRTRFPFLAVAGWDNTVRILSLDPSDLMRQRSTQALTAHAESLALVEMALDANTRHLILHMGLHNGVMQRCEMDFVTGTLSNSRSRFLGGTSVRLVQVRAERENAVLGMSSRTWLTYNYQGSQRLIPLSYETLTSAASFSSEQCEEGVVAVTGNTLRILAIEHLGDTFNQQTIPLTYTPRRLVTHEPSGKLIVLETDHNALCLPELTEMAAKFPKKETDAMQEEEDDDDDEEEDEIAMPGPVPTTSGTWGSQIRVLDPVTSSTLSILPLEANEAALSITTCVFHDRGGEVFILVGVVKNMQLFPTPEAPSSEASIRVYRMVEGHSLVLLHSTPVEEAPLAMTGFRGRVLVGVGAILRVYDLGRRKLLRKCENRHIPTRITKILAAGERIYVGDARESMHFLKYKANENQLVNFADECIPRFITAMSIVDYDTVAGGDKFGNVFVCRLPSDANDEVDNPTGNRMLWDTGLLNGAPNKLTQLCQFHVGEVVTSMVRKPLVPGGAEALIYTGVMGTIGALVPFTNREDVDFYTHLEMFMRTEFPSLVGRDAMQYRSYFLPVKCVTDGDLCERFHALPLEKQKALAVELDRSTADIAKKLEDLRNRLM